MKKVGKYIIISFLLLLGLGCVGVLYLFFVPGTSLFNVTYINKNIVKQSQEFSAEDFSKIELNSRSYEIKILSSEKDTAKIKVRSNSFGFVLKKNSNFNLNATLADNTLTFDVVEPHGFAANNLSKIELYLPKNKEIDLSLKNKNAETQINSTSIQINNFTYSTDNGNLNFVNGKLKGNLNITSNKADFTIKEAVETNYNETTLSLGSGSLKAPTENFGNITVIKNSRGIISVNECATFRGEQKYSGGQINISKAAHIKITAGDTIIKVGEITDAAIIDLTKSGRVSIDKLNGESSISTNSGNISLGTTYSPLTIFSNKGNVSVANAMLTIALTINYGNADINFSNDALSYLVEDSSRVLYASVKNGKLTASGVEHIGEVEDNSTTAASSGVKITGTGRVSLRMNNVYGKNSVVGNNGNVNIVVNKSAIYSLKTSSTNGSVRVNLTQTTDAFGYTTTNETTTNVNCISSVNKLTVSTTSGHLSVLDTNFA